MSETPEGCDSCPNNKENDDSDEVKVPYPVRVGVAIAAGLFLATQSYTVRYGYDPNPQPGSVEVAQVGRWAVETREPNYLLAAGCGAIAMTALGIRFDSLVKFIPGVGGKKDA